MPDRAGDELGASRVVFRFGHDQQDPLLAEELRTDPNAVAGATRFLRIAVKGMSGTMECG